MKALPVNQRGFFAVEIVAYDWMADGGKMDAELVCAPRNGTEFDEGPFLCFRKNTVTGDSGFSVWVRFLLDEARRLSTKRQSDFTFLFGEMSLRDGKVCSMKARAVLV